MSNVDEHESERRDFLYYAAGGAGVVTAGAAIWPLVNQMNPSADVRAASTLRVDISGIQPGAQLRVLFLGKPVFIRRRTEEEIAAARDVDVADLPDQSSRNENAAGTDAADENRSLDEAGEWLVMNGVCTHLGCIPLDNAGNFGGWFCPCHGSHYDLSGRIRQGPAPENLPIPLARFVDESTLVLG